VSGAAAREASGSEAADWWLRTGLVLTAPRAVFAALRDDSEEAEAARAEPVLAILWLAGMASVLSTATAGRLMDHGDYDALLVAVWTFVAGGLYGGFAYWAFGGFVHGGCHALGSTGTYRRARHLLAFAAVPLALSLAVRLLEVAVYGSDVFRRGGADAGAGGRVFEAAALALLAWSAVLLALGVRTVHGWTWARALGALGIAAALPVLAAVLVATL
jgi:hypothetical protein